MRNNGEIMVSGLASQIKGPVSITVPDLCRYAAGIENDTYVATLALFLMFTVVSVTCFGSTLCVYGLHYAGFDSYYNTRQ